MVDGRERQRATTFEKVIEVGVAGQMATFRRISAVPSPPHMADTELYVNIEEANSHTLVESGSTELDELSDDE